MAYEVHIIGLNLVSASIGLALGETEGEVRRTGFDPDRDRAKRALEVGAVDRLVSNPRKDLPKADLVILALPMFELQEFMDVISDQLPEEVIILDASEVKAVSFQWAQEILPPSCHYVGIAPVVGSEALEAAGVDSLQPRADLFAGGLVAISALPDTPKDAVALAINLAKLLGAAPFFIDIHEHDAAFAAVEGLPLLMEAMLLNLNARSPSWREIERTGGHVYASATQSVSTAGYKELGSRLWINREKLLDRLAGLEAEIAHLRKALIEDSERETVRYIQEALSARSNWLSNREKADWADQGSRPKIDLEEGGFLANLLGFRSRKPKAKDPSEDG